MFKRKRKTVIPKKEKDQKEWMRSTSAAIATRPGISVLKIPISPLSLLPLFLSSGQGKHFPQHSVPRNDAKLLTGATRTI